MQIPSCTNKADEQNAKRNMEEALVGTVRELMRQIKKREAAREDTQNLYERLTAIMGELEKTRSGISEAGGPLQEADTRAVNHSAK